MPLVPSLGTRSFKKDDKPKVKRYVQLISWLQRKEKTMAFKLAVSPELICPDWKCNQTVCRDLSYLLVFT